MKRPMVSQTAVSQWETNKNHPDINTIKELMEIFSVTTDYLLNVDSSSEKDNEIIVYNRVPPMNGPTSRISTVMKKSA